MRKKVGDEENIYSQYRRNEKASLAYSPFIFYMTTTPFRALCGTGICHIKACSALWCYTRELCALSYLNHHEGIKNTNEMRERTKKLEYMERKNEKK